MPQCNSCGKKGLFLKIEEDSGLCLNCNEAFAAKGKVLTETIIEAKREAMATEEPAAVKDACEDVVARGEELIRLHEEYHLEPSQELMDLIETYRKMGNLAEK